MQDWIIIDEKYLSYLRGFESRIPFSDYGADKFKPFFGTLFEIGDLVYVTQISHPQKRHQIMRNSLDFYKIYSPSNGSIKSNRLIAVINLNYMFPIPKSIIEFLDYRDIDKHREFSSVTEKSKYINLLKTELAEINKINMESKAYKLYKLKQDYPENPISKRCIEFTELEEKAISYLQEYITTNV